MKIPAGGVIFQAALFSLGDFTFAIHADRLVEVVEAKPGGRIKEISGERLFLADGKSARLFNLANRLGIKVTEILAYLIVDTGTELVAVEATGLVGTSQIYVKPLRGVLRKFTPFGSATISEGGEVTFVIDHLSLGGGVKDEYLRSPA